MATIRLLPSGYWQGIIRKKGYSQQSRTFSTNRDCELWTIDTEAKMNRGVFNDASASEALTLRDGLIRYLAEVTPNKKGHEQETYKIKAMLRNKFTDKTFATFRQSDAANYRDGLSKEGYSASTICNHLSLLSNLFETANKEWAISCQNPIKSISKPKIQNARERRFLNLEEDYLMRALANSGAGDRSNREVIKIVIFAIETGMRKSEPFKLTWNDIDLKSGVAYLKNTITKNGKPRGVPLSPVAIKILKGDDQDDETVVKIRRGNLFNTTYSALSQSFRRSVRRAQRLYYKDVEPDLRIDGFLDDFTYHDLRHEATSRLAEIFEMHELMKIIGHSDSRMLARYYHPSPENFAIKLAKAKAFT